MLYCARGASDREGSVVRVCDYWGSIRGCFWNFLSLGCSTESSPGDRVTPAPCKEAAGLWEP